MSRAQSVPQAVYALDLNIQALSIQSLSTPLASTTPVDVTQANANYLQFSLFPQLPIELRLKIWRETLPGPRIVELPSVNIHQRSGWSPVLAGPIALQINRESREQTLSFYKLCFSSLNHTSPGTYINFTVDTVFMARNTFGMGAINDFLAPMLAQFGDKIQDLALDSHIWSRENVLEALFVLPKLKWLGITCQHVQTYPDTRASEIELIELAEESQVMDKIAEFMRNTVDWVPPNLRVVTVVRGGMRCCECKER
jgi:hypothetical protein